MNLRGIGRVNKPKVDLFSKHYIKTPFEDFSSNGVLLPLYTAAITIQVP